jgi:hypothetical protein
MGCLRNIIALPAGLLAMGLSVATLEMLSQSIVPKSPEMKAAIEAYVRDPQSTEAIEAVRLAIPTMPPAAYYALFAGWTLGALVGGYVAGRVSTSAHLLFGLFLAFASLGAIKINLNAIPHPEWMSNQAVLMLPFIAAVGGALVARTRSMRASAAKKSER